ncbi:hypothetical protein AB0A99_06675 [Streptomyces fradiae]|uniref:hypothetical protein n=1 Tax=Streptomyces fradiae TaxID=1906 RepID=UPI0033FF9F91
MTLLASVGGNRVPVVAQLVRADEDSVQTRELQRYLRWRNPRHSDVLAAQRGERARIRGEKGILS